MHCQIVVYNFGVAAGAVVTSYHSVFIIEYKTVFATEYIYSQVKSMMGQDKHHERFFF